MRAVTVLLIGTLVAIFCVNNESMRVYAEAKGDFTAVSKEYITMQICSRQ